MNTIYDVISIRLLPETITRVSNNENVYCIEADDMMMVPNICPVCRYPLVSIGGSGKIIYDYCSIPFSSDSKHIYKIRIRSKRYKCKNPTIVHTLNQGKRFKKSPYTNAFKHHVVSAYLKQLGVSYTHIAADCSISVPTVSAIMNEFVEQINTWYFPDQNQNYLQLTSFNYQSSTRYYLAEVQNDNKISLLAFFGYQSAEKELEEYLESYRNNCNYAWENTTYIATNMNRKDQEMIQFNLPNTIVSYDNKALYRHFKSFKDNYPDGCYDEVFKKISDIKEIFRNHGDDSQISDWCKDLSLHAVEYLNELQIELQYNLPLLKLSAEKFTADFAVINDDISYYNEHKLPFNIMVLRMMYRNRGDSIFDDGNMNLHFVPKPALWNNAGNLNILEASDDEILREFVITDDEEV